MSRVFQNNEFDKGEPHICCPHCASSLAIRYGSYQRAHPEEPIQVNIQRYLCKSRDCPWITFSVLPHPFLPVVRHFYKTLLACHLLCNVQKMTQAEKSRQMGVSRGVIKRLSAFCSSFVPWLKHEKEVANWGPDPDTDNPRNWPDFTRDFSQSFYPNRWIKLSPTQQIPINNQ